MRLKKQLSGGSVPHLLQIRTSEQRLDAQGSHHMNEHTYIHAHSQAKGPEG